MSLVHVTRVGNRRLNPAVGMRLAIRGGGPSWKGKANRVMKHTSKESTICSVCDREIRVGEQYVVHESFFYCIGCVDWED